MLRTFVTTEFPSASVTDIFIRNAPLTVPALHSEATIPEIVRLSKRGTNITYMAWSGGVGDLVVLRSGFGELTRIAGQRSKRKFAIVRYNEKWNHFDRVGTLVERQALISVADELYYRLRDVMHEPPNAADWIFAPKDEYMEGGLASLDMTPQAATLPGIQTPQAATLPGIQTPQAEDPVP